MGKMGCTGRVGSNNKCRSTGGGRVQLEIWHIKASSSHSVQVTERQNKRMTGKEEATAKEGVPYSDKNVVNSARQASLSPSTCSESPCWVLSYLPLCLLCSPLISRSPESF